MRHQLSAFTFVTLGMLLGVFWTGGCGGGGGGGATAAQQNQVFNRIHVSTVGGVVATPGDTITVVRELTYIPSSANDIVHQVIVDGTYDKTGPETGTWSVELLDSNDRIIGLAGGQINNPGNGVVFGSSFHPLPGQWAAEAVYPSPSYKIRLTVNTSGVSTFVGQITSTRFRVITSEKVILESPSSRITG